MSPKLPPSEYLPVNHKPRNIPKFVSPHARALRRQEEEIHEMVAEAKKKIKFGQTQRNRLALCKESGAILNSLLLGLRRRKFTLGDINKIVLPIFPKGTTINDIKHRTQKRISIAERAQGRPKIDFRTTKRLNPRWQTIEEKHAEALELNEFHDKVKKIRTKNPMATLTDIAKELGITPININRTNQISKKMKILRESVSEPKKKYFSTKTPKKKIRKPVFIKEEKFRLVYKEHAGLIKQQLGKKYHWLQGTEFEELVREVKLRLIDELDLFDPDRSKVSTFIGNRAIGLASHIHREKSMKDKGKPEYFADEKRRILREQRNQ